LQIWGCIPEKEAEWYRKSRWATSILAAKLADSAKILAMRANQEGQKGWAKKRRGKGGNPRHLYKYHHKEDGGVKINLFGERN
jgi:hypothetical protein